MTQFVGIDASWTGLAVLANAQNSSQFELFETNPQDFACLEARLDYLGAAVLDAVEGYGPTTPIAIEGYSFNSKGSSGVQMGILGGHIRWLLWSAGYAVVSVPPATLKKFVTGSGTSAKAVMLKEVWRRWRFDTDNDNVADAFGLSKVAEAYVTEGQSKAVAKLLQSLQVTYGRIRA